MKNLSPSDLFFDQLKDLFSVETQLTATLPLLAASVHHAALRELILRHSDETDHQKQSLVDIFHRYGMDPGDDKCKAMEGLIKGGNQHLEKVRNPETRDLMMVAHCMRIEHYEIAAYGITLRLAERLGMADAADVLSPLLKQEVKAAEALVTIEPVLFEIANRQPAKTSPRE